MEIFWNKINLQRPPYRSCHISTKEHDPERFIKVLEKILIDFKSWSILNKEAALLSRLIYRMKSKFRNDKGFKYMEKVNRGLLNYLNMSLENEYQSLKKYIEIHNGIVSLPSRQNIEYILIKTQGFAKLMCHIESTALAAGNVLKSRLHIGQSWSVAIIAYAIISRIWFVSRHIVRKICVWYNDIYEYVNILKTVGMTWLPDNYMLPENLSKWLDVPWLNEDIKIFSMEGNCKKSIFNLIEVNNTHTTNLSAADNVIIQTSEKEIKEFYVQQSELIFKQDNDIGKPISRSSFKTTYKRSQNINSEVNKLKKLKKSLDR